MVGVNQSSTAAHSVTFEFECMQDLVGVSRFASSMAATARLYQVGAVFEFKLYFACFASKYVQIQNFRMGNPPHSAVQGQRALIPTTHIYGHSCYLDLLRK